MPVPDHARSEVVFKIVYAGAEGAGKTTSLAGVHGLLGTACEPAVGTETGSDHTIAFGYRPARPLLVRGLSARFQMLTVPGPVHYAATWQLALRGADGIVFVVDSDPSRKAANATALRATLKALQRNRSSLADIPLVFQFNKRDIPAPVPVAELDALLNVLEPKAPVIQSCAERGDGLLATLESLSRAMLARFGGEEVSRGGGAPTPRPATGSLAAAS